MRDSRRLIFNLRSFLGDRCTPGSDPHFPLFWGFCAIPLPDFFHELYERDVIFLDAPATIAPKSFALVGDSHVFAFS
jgi:hypothetical protein